MSVLELAKIHNFSIQPWSQGTSENGALLPIIIGEIDGALEDLNYTLHFIVWTSAFLPETWLFILAFLTGLATLNYCHFNVPDMCQALLNTLIVFIGESVDRIKKQRLVFSIAAFSGMFLCSLYGNSITSLIVSPQLPLRFRTLGELLQNGFKVYCTLAKDELQNAFNIW